MLPRYTPTHWSGLLCHACRAALMATTEIEFGHQTATLPNLWSSDSAVRCRHMDHVGKWYPQAAVFSHGMPASDTGRQIRIRIRNGLMDKQQTCTQHNTSGRCSGWQDNVKNVDIADTTGLPNITDIVDKKRHALFGHAVRLDTSVGLPAHQALKQVIAMKSGRCSGTNWRRLPGRPRKTWIQQIGDGTTTSWKQMWQSAEERGHLGEPSQRTTAVYASRWWWWWWYYRHCRQFLRCHMDVLQSEGF